MGDEPIIEDYIRGYNILRNEFDMLLKCYRDLQKKKYNQLVAEVGDVRGDRK